jgi:hypothetical protein
LLTAVISVPTSSLVSVRWGPAAPSIGLPSACQRISDSLGVGDQAPGVAVSVWLTIASPLTTGVSTALNTPLATGPEVGTVTVDGAYFLWVAMTLTEIV